MTFEYFKKAGQLAQAGKPFVTVTMLSHRGHAPQDNGAKAIVTTEGLFSGTVGGGKVEAKAIVFAQQLLLEKATASFERVTWNLQKDVGMTCGGEVEFVFELSSPKIWKVCVFGAGHVAQAVVRLLLTLDLTVECYDPRQEWLDKMPQLNDRLKCHLYNSEDDLDKVVSFESQTYYLCLSQGHSFDMPILKSILLRGSPEYIGVIGSPVKALQVRKALLEVGVPADRVEKLYCPMGLKIGSNAPSEIAISIAAQILGHRDQRKSQTQPHS